MQTVNNEATAADVNDHALLLWETEGRGQQEGGRRGVIEILLVHQGVSEPISSRISCERMKVKK